MAYKDTLLQATGRRVEAEAGRKESLTLRASLLGYLVLIVDN